jgi:hypothetical protein
LVFVKIKKLKKYSTFSVLRSKIKENQKEAKF